MVDDRQQHVVQFTCRHLRGSGFSDFQGSLQSLQYTLLFHIAREYNWNVRERRGSLANHLLHLVHGVLILLNKVPFVHHHNHATVALHHLPEDVQILTTHGVAAVQHQHAYIALVNGLDGPNRAVKLEVIRDLSLLSQPGRVHNFKIETKHFVSRVHTVSGGARYVRHDVPLLAQYGVDECRLADIGLSHHGQLRQPQLFIFCHFWQHLHDSIQQLPCAVSIVGRNPVNLIRQTQTVKLLCSHIVGGRIHLVAHQHHRLARATQQIRNVLI